MLLIQAFNIHTGGGATLLGPLLQVPFAGVRRVWVDARFCVPKTLAPDVEVRPVQRSFADRLRADVEAARQASAGDMLLCLGNLPPIWRPACRTVVYLQSRYLVGEAQLGGIPLAERARLTVERIWLRTLVSHAHIYLVQTPSMKRAACEHLGLPDERVRIAPFLPADAYWPRTLSAQKPVAHNDPRPFLYVASGELHKNHRTLVQAWTLLAGEGLFPPLQLTLDQARFPVLAHWVVEQVRQHDLQVEVNAAYGQANLGDLYRRARALIFPSRVESFGLPLVEARQAGLPVLAPELDYVRDVLDPDEVFDPGSARSIARAVKRFMGLVEPDLPSMDVKRFLQMLWVECRQ